MNNRRALRLLILWLFVATLFTQLGGLRLLPPPFPQLLLASLVLALAVVYASWSSFRSWLSGLSSRPFLALHLSRFVGAYFLVLYDRGELPYSFAVLGGWGDIAVASLALVLLVVVRGGPPVRSVPLQAWNLFGLADILFVVVTAARSALAAPDSMAPLLELPLGLLPTFLVPLIVFSHGVLLLRGLGADRNAA